MAIKALDQKDKEPIQRCTEYSDYSVATRFLHILFDQYCDPRIGKINSVVHMKELLDNDSQLFQILSENNYKKAKQVVVAYLRDFLEFNKR